MGGLRGDAARLAATGQTVALSAVFDRLRTWHEDMVGFDTKKLIERPVGSCRWFAAGVDGECSHHRWPRQQGP